MKTQLSCSMATLALAASLFGYPTLAQTETLAAPTPIAVPAAQNARPNVLIWMLDDIGYAQLSSFGGLVETPNIDRVAQRGLRYINYSTAAICSASRAAMLTGRNPHSVHMGGHAAAPLPLPGYDGRIPPEAGTIAANFREAGYSTFALGKWDHLPTSDMTPAGPFTLWPTGQGFDKFYGFLGPDTDNWHPPLINGITPVSAPKIPGYHLNHDLADQAITMIAERRAREVPAPFFMYFATGIAHAPHHAPQAWIDRYKGKFDMGWDKAREQILQRQIAGGLIPKGAKLAPRPPGMQEWSTLSADEKRLFARQMEVFAASLGYADEQFGRVLDSLAASGELDNTIIAITSDNGASAEGSYNGTYNEFVFINGPTPPTVAENLPFIDKWGGPESYPHYAFGWAVAGNTPHRFFKQTTYQGGLRVPLILSWPKAVPAKGELRNQFVFVSDIAPTLLGLAGVPLAKTLNNVVQMPMEGTDISYTFADPATPGRKSAQYFEMYGNKALWADGWTIVTAHRLEPWRMDQNHEPNEPWELYNVANDPGETINLAAKFPERLQAMATLFNEQASLYNVMPISNMGASYAASGKSFSEEFFRRKGRWTYADPISSLSFSAAPPIAILPFRMTARLDLPAAALTGPIITLGGSNGGMGLYLKNGVLNFLMRDLEGVPTQVVADKPLAAGMRNIELILKRPTVRSAELKPVTVTILADGKVLASQQVQAKLPAGYGMSETFDIGIDYGSSLSADYPMWKRFPGKISHVNFDFSQP